MNPAGVLIVGAAGFVGRSLAARLSSKGYKVFAISTRYPEGGYPEDIEYHVTSLDDEAVLQKVLPQCNIVFYLASHSTPGYSAHQPSIEAESNLLPCLRFLEILEKYKKILMVYLSSGGAVYGNTFKELNTENLPLKPLSYYGAGKAAIEKFLLAYQSQTQNKILILRPSNLYGPGQTRKEGFGIIPTIFQSIRDETSVTIWGNGETVRDYLYIDDFIELCMIILEKRTGPTLRRRIYNVGSGHGASLNTLISLISEFTGVDIKREYLDSRGVDVDRNILDCSRLEQDYKWKAHCDLTEGLKVTWQWFTRNK